MSNTNLVTRAGKEKVEADLKYRKTQLREEIANRINEAKKQGDLSENAAYTSAIEEFQLNERRILELTKELRSLKIVKDKTGDDKVDLGDTVTLQVVKTGEIQKFTIGGLNEADPTSGKISNGSPLGKQLLGLSKGDTFTLTLPVGVREYKILEVS